MNNYPDNCQDNNPRYPWNDDGYDEDVLEEEAFEEAGPCTCEVDPDDCQYCAALDRLKNPEPDFEDMYHERLYRD